MTECSDHTCKYCGKPTTECEFFTLPSGRVWAHIECMLREGEKLLKSGAMDDARIGVKWPDGAAEITTGKRLRERFTGRDPDDAA
jgi:hypothetical protein